MRFTLDATFYSDEDSTSSEEEETELFDYYDEDSEEEEEPHPLGFGRTRYGFYDHDEYVQKTSAAAALIKLQRSTLAPSSRYQQEANFESSTMRIQSFPSLYSDGRISQRTANAATVLHHHTLCMHEEKENEFEFSTEGKNDSENRIQNLLSAAFSGISISDKPNSPIKNVSPLSSTLPPSQIEDFQDYSNEIQQIREEEALCLLALQREMKFSTQEAEEKKKLRQLKIDQDHKEAIEGLRLLLHQDERDAKIYEQNLEKELEEAKKREKLIAEEQRRKNEEESRKEKEELERSKVQREAQKELQKQQSQVATVEEKKKTPEKGPKESKKLEQPAYIQKGLQRISKLVDFRQSISVFDKSKAVSRRRLNMKKIVKGKLNTLNHSKEKITAIVKDIYAAMKTSKDDDQAAKADGQQPPEASKGLEYLLDLLASNLVVRIQAEGFNGVKGDGFPIANLIVILCTQVKDLVPIVTAHLFTICPTLIPSIPKSNVKEMSEDELMESLGMARKKDGEFETFERFLARTEGIISVAAGMMSSRPSAHVLLGGNNGAVKFLEHFLEQLDLSDNISTLPLITAPVLVSFLTIAGHMLARKFPDKFRPLLDIIITKVCPNVDKGAFGAPSATRLDKLVGGGFDWFEKTLPAGAVADFYSGASQSASETKPLSATSSSFASGNIEQKSTIGNDFSNITQQVQKFSNNPFPASSSNQNPSPFGASSSGTPSPSPFGGFGSTNQESQVQSNPYGNSSMSNTQNSKRDNSYRPICKFFAQGKCRNGNNCKFVHEIPNETQTGSFNSSSQNQSTPFGQQSTKPSNPFGGSSQNNTFGGSTATTQQNANPFGGSTASQQSSNPFGGSSSSQQNSNPFGGSVAATQSTNPFGGSSGIQNASPFGGHTSNQSSPFGASKSGSSFGGFGNVGQTAATGGNPFQRR